MHEAFLGSSDYRHAGQRVVEGQRLMQATSDIFLGWLTSPEDLDGRVRDYYVRQLRDWKGSAEVDAMTAEELISYGRLCGATLARAHARSGDRIAIAAYLGSGDVFDRALAGVRRELRRPERARLRRTRRGREVGARDRPDRSLMPSRRPRA